jgi:hypothetical protein
LIPLLVIVGVAPQAGIQAGDASERSANAPLWLNGQALAPDLRKEWSAVVQRVYGSGSSAVLLHARNELIAASAKLTGRQVGIAESVDGDGTVLLGTRAQLQDMLPRMMVERGGALKDGGYPV